MQADEVLEVSNMEQLGLVLHYVKNGKPVKKLAEFVACQEVTGSAICNNLIYTLRGPLLWLKY